MKLRLLVHLILCATVGGCGGAISRASFDDLEHEVDLRNAARHQAATDEFLASGFEWATDQTFSAAIGQEVTERCAQARRNREYGPGEVGTVEIRGTIGDGHPANSVTVLAAPLERVCAFFVSNVDEFVGNDSEGAEVRFVRTQWPVARDRAGDLVLVDMITEVVSEETERVDMRCNEMPDPGPGPFSFPPDAVAVVRPPLPGRHVRLVVEREELDYECARTLH